LSDRPKALTQFARDLAPAKRRSLAEDVTERLRLAIVRGEFAPGQHLNETALAESLGTSRGPIREALVELERVGLLTIERHRGARISRLAQEDITEIYELRRALERLAMERAVLHATPEDFAAMDAIVAAMAEAVAAKNVFRTVELDIGFHDLVYRAARHSRLYASWSRLRPQIEFFLQNRARDPTDYLKIAVREHGALRDVIRTGPVDHALVMIDEHLRSAYERLSQLRHDPPVNDGGTIV
jgi:DNA-binding GntR family transcriptional regulator